MTSGSRDTRGTRPIGVHVIRCADSHQLLCSLYALPHLVGGAAPAMGAARQPARKLRMLVVDSMSAFQWVERAWGRPSLQPPGARTQAADCLPLPATSHPVARQRPSLMPAPQVDEQICALLRKVLLEQQICAVWSRCPATSHGAGRQFPMQNGAPPSWANLAAHRLDLKRVEPPADGSRAEARLVARLVSFSYASARAAENRALSSVSNAREAPRARRSARRSQL